MKHSYPIMHLPNIRSICIYILSLTWNKHRHTIHTRRQNKSNAYILKQTPQYRCIIKSNTYIIHITWSFISKCHSCSVKLVLVCLLTAGRSVRRRLWPAARIVGCCKDECPCGEEGGNSQAYTLSPLQRLSVYVSACARVSVCQCCTSACLPQETTTSIERTHHNGHRYANARNMHLKLRTYTPYGNV